MCGVGCGVQGTLVGPAKFAGTPSTLHRPSPGRVGLDLVSLFGSEVRGLGVWCGV